MFIVVEYEYGMRGFLDWIGNQLRYPKLNTRTNIIPSIHPEQPQ
jgi:hypothetical protein